MSEYENGDDGVEANEGISNAEWFNQTMREDKPTLSEEEDDQYGDIPEMLEDDYTGWIGDREKAVAAFRYLVEKEGVSSMSEMVGEYGNFVRAVESHYDSLEELDNGLYRRISGQEELIPRLGSIDAPEDNLENHPARILRDEDREGAKEPEFTGEADHEGLRFPLTPLGPEGVRDQEDDLEIPSSSAYIESRFKDTENNTEADLLDLSGTRKQYKEG